MKECLAHLALVASCTLLLLFVSFHHSSAENINQDIELHPGWNAVFLEVDPDVGDIPDGRTHIEMVLQQYPIPNLIGIWLWNPDTSTVEYIQNPYELTPDMPQWLVHFPDRPFLNNLHAIHGERGYLLELGGTDTFLWRVTGEPQLPRIKWKPDSFNYVGFHLDPGNEPFFENFFSSSPALAGQEIYIQNGHGNWELVTDPATTRMKHGEGFWIYCKGHSEFAGPLSLQLNQRSGLDYGKILSEQSLRLKNSSAADVSVSLSLAGTFPLSHWKFDPDNDDVGWKNFPLSQTISPGVKEIIRMGVRRSGLSPDTLYESNLEIVSDNGIRIIVPASLEGISHAGLWVGAATINKVSEPRVNPDAQFPLTSKTGSELSFRLILHVDDTGSVKLLKQVIQMWDATESRFVLFTDDDLIPRFSTTSLTGVTPPVRRISTAAFSLMSQSEPRYEASMAGSFDEANGSLSCTITVEQDDPMNPFRHRYHPDHKEPEQAYEVSRQIQMIFSSEDSDGNPLSGAPSLGWGGSDMGGIYRETITGLHRDAIRVEGTFLLHRVSNVENLEPGSGG